MQIYDFEYLEAALTQYGNFSIQRKAKILNKFGQCTAAADERTTVAEFQGDIINEVFATGNTISHIVSSHADDNQLMSIEGLTLNSQNQMVFRVQRRQLDGQTPVALDPPLFRSTRMRPVASGDPANPTADLQGNIAVFDDSAAGSVVDGVPQTNAATKLLIIAGSQFTRKAATALSKDDAWVVTGATIGLRRQGGADAHADVEIEYREMGGVWVSLGGVVVTANEGVLPFSQISFEPPEIVPPNSDVRMVATSDISNTRLFGVIHGFLAGRVQPSVA